MSDEMENMQSENQMPAQDEMPEQNPPAADADAPVKKRRGRPPKKRPEAGADGAAMDAAPDLPLESAPEEKPAAPVQASFGSKSASHEAASSGSASEADFGDDGGVI